MIFYLITSEFVFQVSADVDTLHTILTVERHEDATSLTTRLEECWEELFGTQYDVIAFLYSVVLTKVVKLLRCNI